MCSSDLSLEPFSQTYSLRRGFIGLFPKIFVMRGPIDLRFGMNVNRLFAVGGHMTTATLNQSAMTKWYPEIERAAWR